MQVLPSGLVVPPLPHLVILLAVDIVFVTLLYFASPRVTPKQVVAFGPWMAAGGTLHALYGVHEASTGNLFSPLIAPLFSAPTVYLSTFAPMGLLWITSAFLAEVNDQPDRVPRDLAASGLGIFIVLAAVTLWQSLGFIQDAGGTGDILTLYWPAIGFLGAGIITAPVYYALTLWRTGAVAKVGLAGPFVTFAHVLDGFSTAIGADVIGVAERSPLPRLLMEQAAKLPTAEFIGKGWVFLLVKTIVPLVVVVLFADYVDEEPQEGNLMLAAIAAFGLGPAANNLFLFTFRAAPFFSGG
jgi:uncharacterized membrane protein